MNAVVGIILIFSVMIIIFAVMIFFASPKRRDAIRRNMHREKALDVIFITKNNNLVKGVVPIENDASFKYEGDTYVISKKAIYTQKFRMGQRPYSVYLKGHPDPILFDFKKKTADFSGQDLNKFVESQVIQQLLSGREDKMLPIALILIFVSILLIAVGIYMNYKTGQDITTAVNEISSYIIR